MYFSKSDEVLQIAYGGYKLFKAEALGYSGIIDLLTNPKAPNVDLVDTTPGHSDLGPHGEIYTHIDFTYGLWDKTSEVYRRTYEIFMGKYENN